MKFSILIPTLNEEKYIGKLLDSLMEQTLSDFEVIMVDAHSDDETVAVVKKYQKFLNIKTINSKKRNISYQRNLAAKNATTENLIFFDADVIVDSKFLEKINFSLNRHRFEFAASWIEPLSDRLIDRIVFGLFNRVYLETVKHFAPAGSGAFLYVRKKAFRAVKGFDVTTNFGEDFDLVKRLHQRGSKYYLFKKPSVEFSTRRLDKEGRIFFFYKMIRSGLYYHLRGTIHDKKIYLKNEFGKF